MMKSIFQQFQATTGPNSLVPMIIRIISFSQPCVVEHKVRLVYNLLRLKSLRLPAHSLVLVPVQLITILASSTLVVSLFMWTVPSLHMVIELKDRYEGGYPCIRDRTGSSGACFHRDINKNLFPIKYLVLYLLSSVDCDPQSPNVGWCLFLGRWNKKVSSNLVINTYHPLDYLSGICISYFQSASAPSACSLRSFLCTLNKLV